MKLAIFDLDGTLLRGDTSCQTIARVLGKYERMCELENLAGQGQAPARAQVEAARVEMAGWYIDAGRERVEAALSELCWEPGVMEGMGQLVDAGVGIALASITWSFIVEHAAQHVGANWHVGTELNFESGEVVHSWGTTKKDFLLSTARELNIDAADVAAVGDSSGDDDMLRAAGLGIFVGAKPPGIANIVHMPDADIRDVAAAILNHV